MRAIVLLRLAPGVDLTEVAANIDAEVAELWRLYTAGPVSEVYLTEDRATVVSVAEAEDVDQIRTSLADLPLVAKGLMTTEIHALLPFRNWERLFSRP